MIDATLKSLVSWMPYNSLLTGGMKIPSRRWFIKKYAHRSGMIYQIAITGISNQNLN